MKLIIVLTGPFAMTENRMLGVDFSVPVTINEWTLVVPLRKHTNVKLIFTIFSYETWFILGPPTTNRLREIWLTTKGQP